MALSNSLSYMETKDSCWLEPGLYLYDLDNGHFIHKLKISLNKSIFLWSFAAQTYTHRHRVFVYTLYNETGEKVEWKQYKHVYCQAIQTALW